MEGDLGRVHHPQRWRVGKGGGEGEEGERRWREEGGREEGEGRVKGEVEGNGEGGGE